MKELNLSQFNGTETWWAHWSKRITYTDGVKYVADNAGHGAYWLIDVIASYQIGAIAQKEFQVWHLELDKDDVHKAIVTMRAESSERKDKDAPILITQRIEHTDFPIDIELWLIDKVLILPSEY